MFEEERREEKRRSVDAFLVLICRLEYVDVRAPVKAP
jgi:hypothetical protein